MTTILLSSSGQIASALAAGGALVSQANEINDTELFLVDDNALIEIVHSSFGTAALVEYRDTAAILSLLTSEPTSKIDVYIIVLSENPEDDPVFMLVSFAEALDQNETLVATTIDGTEVLYADSALLETDGFVTHTVEVTPDEAINEYNSQSEADNLDTTDTSSIE